MIHLEHVYKSFGKQEVLHDICLDIQDGEVVGLLGPNGAGKSTLMKIMLGLWKADSGVVEVPSTHGYLPELNPLYDYMFVREYLEFMFRVESEEWTDLDTDYPKRRITKIGYVQEVSAVNYPAYAGTSINARNKNSLDSDKKALDEARAKLVDTEKEKDLELEKLKAEYLYDL